MNDPAFAGVREQARSFRSGEYSPVELTKLYLHRIERFDGELRAYITVLAEEALHTAAVAERELRDGVDRGLLHGIPFAVKDVIAVRGALMTAGSRAFGDRVSPEDATVVARMRRAGAVLLGTLNAHELQLGGTTEFAYGIPRNPWDVQRVSGGSSSGSAVALAAGLCTVTLGGDTGGSIRIPAAYCGLAGLRPTWSRVSRSGVMPAAWFLDCVGPFGRTVEDVAIVLGAIAGRDERDPSSSHEPVPDYMDGLDAEDGTPLRIGVVESFFPRAASPKVESVFSRALETLGQTDHVAGSVAIPHTDWTPYIHAALVDPAAAATVPRDIYPRLDRNSRVRLLSGAALPDRYGTVARHASAEIRRHVLEALDRFDVLVAPTADAGAPLIEPAVQPRGDGEEQDAFSGGSGAAATLNRVFSFAGTPAISVPCGQDEVGMPLGLQIVGRPFHEQDVLRVAARFDRARAWECTYPMSVADRAKGSGHA